MVSGILFKDHNGVEYKIRPASSNSYYVYHAVIDLENLSNKARKTYIMSRKECIFWMMKYTLKNDYGYEQASLDMRFRYRKNLENTYKMVLQTMR